METDVYHKTEEHSGSVEQNSYQVVRFMCPK